MGALAEPVLAATGVAGVLLWLSAGVLALRRVERRLRAPAVLTGAVVTALAAGLGAALADPLTWWSGDEVVIGDTAVDGAEVANLGLATAVVLGLSAAYRWTAAGLATRAVAGDPLVAASLGWSRRRVVLASLAIAAVLGAAGGALAPARLAADAAWLLLPAVASAAGVGGRAFGLVVPASVATATGLELLDRRVDLGPPRPATVVATAAAGVVVLASGRGVRWARIRRRARAVAAGLRASASPAAPIPAPSPVAPRRLEVRDLRVIASGVATVDGVSFAVEPGEIVGLAGPLGAGKTAVLDAVRGTQPATGAVLLGERDASGRSTRWRARAGLRVSASQASASRRRVVDVLAVAGGPPQAAVDVIRQLELRDELDRRMADLTPARRRLVAAAAALAGAASVVVLDEPSAGLDDGEAARLTDAIRAAAMLGVAVLVADSDVQFVLDRCDRVVVLERGRVVAQGPPATVATHPAVVAAYLGEAA